MNIYGYCRISTAKQSIDRQIRNIKPSIRLPYRTGSLHCTSIFARMAEALSDSKIWGYGGVRFGVPNVQKCRRGFTLYEDLYHKGIRLVFLKEHHIDTETYKKSPVRQHCHDRDECGLHLEGHQRVSDGFGKEQIKLAFEQSEKEVADLHQRTREGLLTARLNGKQVGRKKGVGFETKKAREAKQDYPHSLQDLWRHT